MHKIIDVHSHLGDTFASEKNVIYKGDLILDPKKYDPFDAFSKRGFEGALLDPKKPEEIETVIAMTAEVSYANTLTKLSRQLTEAQIDYVCLCPIAPYMNFEDYRVASLIEPRIIPFTSADWRSRDARLIGEKLLRDAQQGARGLKIHPILQNISLRDPLVERVLRIWAQTGLPVASHCGVNSYYPENSSEFKTQCPENGNLDDFVFIAKLLPEVKFISVHAGGLAGGEEEVLAGQLAGAENLWVDTTFRSAAGMLRLIELFGEDRVMFGVDRPFAGSAESVQVAFEAFGKGTPLSEKIMYRNAAKLLGWSE